MHHDPDGLDLIDADIRRQDAVLKRAIPVLRETSDRIAGELPTPARVFLIGCGDSYDAGIAARFVWEGLTGMPAEAVPAMTFATSVVDLAPRGSLVVALSQSGRVSRVVEGLRKARARGLSTISITANPTSALAKEPADATWVMDFEKLGAIPGTTSHLQGSIALYELACAFSERGADRDVIRASVDGLPELVGEVVDRSAEIGAEHAATMDRANPVLALGYGPSSSSARFTVRKLLELSQLIAISQETEEYAHDEYSLVDQRFRVLLFAPPDLGRSRSHEVAGYLKRLGVNLAVVSDGDEAATFTDTADLVYDLPACDPVLVPMLYAVPGQLLSLATARRVGGSLYGMAEQVHREDGDPQIYESVIAS